MRTLTLAMALVAAVTLASGKVSYSGYKFVKVQQSTADEAQLVFRLEAEAMLKLANDDAGRVGKEAIAYLPPGQEGVELEKMLEQHGLKYEVLDYDVQELFDAEWAAIEKRREEWKTLKLGDTRAVDFDIFDFHTHSEINQYLYDLEGKKQHTGK